MVALEFGFEFFDGVEEGHESLPEGAERVLDSWRDLGVGHTIDDPEAHEFVEALGEDLAREARGGPGQCARARDSPADLEQDVHGPLAADDVFKHGPDARGVWRGRAGGLGAARDFLVLCSGHLGAFGGYPSMR